MNRKILYRTYPRLIFVVSFFSGFVFFILLSILCLKISSDINLFLRYSLFSIFAVFSIISFYYLLKIKSIFLTNDELIIRNFLLPKIRRHKLTEIDNIRQSKKITRNYLGQNIFEKGYLLTKYETTIDLNDGENINFISITELDFKTLNKNLVKLKRSEGKVKKTKRTMSLYLFENMDGLLLMLLTSILNIGMLFILIKTVANTVYN